MTTNAAGSLALSLSSDAASSGAVTKPDACRSWFRLTENPERLRSLPMKIMNLYSTSVFLHVLAAILGLGPLTALAIVSSSSASAMPFERFVQLLRIVGWSLAALLVTGVLVIAQTRGDLGQTGWVRVSVGLFLVLGGLHGLVRRRLKQDRAAAPSFAWPRGLSPLLWTMCALVAAITYLMEAKPW